MISREERIKQIPPSMQSVYRKSATSRTSAVKAFCHECCGYDRVAVRECSAVACPLYAFRPHQTAEDDGEESQGDENGTP